MAMEDIEASEVGTPEAKFRAILIEIDKDDTPEIIREKADLITDVVDRLKRRLRDLERRVEELEREMETEERIRDLLDEISLFDEDVFAGHRLQVQTRAEETKGIRGIGSQASIPGPSSGDLRIGLGDIPGGDQDTDKQAQGGDGEVEGKDSGAFEKGRGVPPQGRRT